MLNRRAHGHSQAEQPKIQTLRKISASDRFPCFACFDHPREKINCKECGGNGWIPGSHPMVQFAQDFIEKRLQGMGTSDMNNSSNNHSDFGDIAVRMSGSYDPRKKPVEVFPLASTKTVALGDEIRQSHYNQVDEPLTQQYFCNECSLQDEPIRGKRFHCLECQDYDLCQSCFNLGKHGIHKLKEIAAIRKPDNETMVRQIKDTLLKKSIKYTK